MLVLVYFLKWILVSRRCASPCLFCPLECKHNAKRSLCCINANRVEKRRAIFVCLVVTIEEEGARVRLKGLERTEIPKKTALTCLPVQIGVGFKSSLARLLARSCTGL